MADPESNEECLTAADNAISLPAKFAERYHPEWDPASEADIVRYVEAEALENVRHAELVKTEFVAGDKYEIWDVITGENRWWVLTNLTNLYSQRHFPSLDYTLSFHVGLMMRLRTRPDGPEADHPTPFDDVFRRQKQAKERLDRAVEPEDYQAVGMQLRECLISLVAAVRRQAALTVEGQRPQDANFIEWSEVLLNALCGGPSNDKLRRYLKGVSEHTWQLVNWLTHYRSADEMACSIAIHGSDTIVGHFVQILERSKTKDVKLCAMCGSREIRSHYDPEIPPDGDYFVTCGVCEWSTHPGLPYNAD